MSKQPQQSETAQQTANRVVSTPRPEPARGTCSNLFVDPYKTPRVEQAPRAAGTSNLGPVRGR